MGLTQKILLFTSALIIALTGITLAYTTIRADRLAQQTVEAMLGETRGVWDTYQENRFRQLLLGVRVLANDAAFKAGVETGDEPTIADMLQERGQDLLADFFIATDYDGIVLARSDRIEAQGQDLSEDPIVGSALEGEESATVWKQDGRFYHAVSVPMLFGPDLIGILVAGYAIDEPLANEIRKLTHSEIAFLTREPGGRPVLSVSSLGPREDDLRAALGQATLRDAPFGERFELNLSGERYVGLKAPLEDAAGVGLGSVLALRSLDAETAAFRGFRNSLIAVSVGVMLLALVLGGFAARQITEPVRRLVALVEKARDGSYAGAVSVATSDEIGTLARAFNGLLADLREKEQMVEFLREGQTIAPEREAATADTRVAEAPTRVAGAPDGGTSASFGDVMKLETGSLFAGRYEIQGTLGKGGMGIVYLAMDTQLEEKVAVKLLRPEVLQADPTLLQRFKQETRMARRITHRNVLRTHDFGEVENTPYISMEYVEGVMLKQLIRNRGALPLGVGLRIAKQICVGLEAAHTEGVVHRDIKPQNILILPETGDVRVMDFGIARVSEVQADSGLTTEGTVLGTPDYMPPEQAQGKPADFRSDVYSLGVVLFEIFTGRLPFEAENPMAMILKHIQTPPPSPRQYNTQIPEGLERVILLCIEKEPEQRYQRVSELLSVLDVVSSRVEA